ncbi:MAG TPA: hypothetical protein VIK27_09555, partial [Candidatus Aquilonibacter sp.]
MERVFVPQSRGLSLSELRRRGRFEELRAALNGRQDVDALIEQARLAYSQDNDPAAALEVIDTILARDCTTDQRLLAQSLRLVPAAALGIASGAIDPARFSQCDPTIVSEAIYFIALAAYMRDDHVAAEL